MYLVKGRKLGFVIGQTGSNRTIDNFDGTSAGGGGASFMIDYDNNTAPMVITAGGNGPRENRHNPTYAYSGSPNDGNINDYYTIRDNFNFQGSSSSYGGYIAYGGFGYGTGSDDSDGAGGGLNRTFMNSAYSYINTSSYTFILPSFPIGMYT